jgi:hypothetical protein
LNPAPVTSSPVAVRLSDGFAIGVMIRKLLLLWLARSEDKLTFQGEVSLQRRRHPLDVERARTLQSLELSGTANDFPDTGVK